jgi:hypothetical protein
MASFAFVVFAVKNWISEWVSINEKKQGQNLEELMVKIYFI